MHNRDKSYLASGNTKPFLRSFKYPETISIGHHVHFSTMGISVSDLKYFGLPDGCSHFKIFKIYHFPSEIHLIGDWVE